MVVIASRRSTGHAADPRLALPMKSETPSLHRGREREPAAEQHQDTPGSFTAVRQSIARTQLRDPPESKPAPSPPAWQCRFRKPSQRLMPR